MAKINSKIKGSRVEREIAKTLTDRFKKDFTRVPMSGAFATFNQNKTIRQDSLDVMSGDIICPDGFLFSIEVKSRKDFNFFEFFNKKSELREWLQQAFLESTIAKKKALLIVKINHHEAFVFINSDSDISDMKFEKWQILTLENLFNLPDNFFFKNA